ncbi:alpha/beta hydrolase [Limoniibacter endophyticus]|uniref:2-hydroxymuconic semialdehyde hydrolase n=1 Tax=Limoniibacter endophyticus TaxID=1565040 RepID=A0A8J3DG93_9HYPH|nr:alpha/beta hydrolase [Limoniibacter endophyticus]GHC66939.1 2-hydroxymuconic semialdehyde hydrolase [Limoniibacter endophyticus]
MTTTHLKTLDVDGKQIAYRFREGKTQPGLVWLGGYRSDMLGTKAEALDAFAERRGHAFLRHDYSGHGESGGDFMHGTVSAWVRESLAIFDEKTSGPQILIGSSMGAWIALRMLEELHKRGEKQRVAGIALIAPAPDFVMELVVPQMRAEDREALEIQGYFEVPSRYPGMSAIYTKALIEDGPNNRTLGKMIDTHCHVHILQGLQDEDVPYAHALKLAQCLPSDDVTMTTVKDGDHRLSREQDLALLVRTIEGMIADL